jgi:predicted extracellular nuclease
MVGRCRRGQLTEWLPMVQNDAMSVRCFFGALVTVLVCSAAFAAPASAQSTELFFSEYVEGSSNNKALEIFNGTGAPVSLAAGGYNVQMFFNGNPVATLTINLTGTVADGDVYVLAHSSAVAAILDVADQTNGSGWFNGDDAVVLRRGTTVIDAIGQAGFDPGTQWGSGLASTADNTLRRQLSVTDGDPNATDAFDPSAEWTGFDQDTFGGLGCHTADISCATPPPPPPVLAAIWQIQGAGMSSPLVNQRVRTVDNVVTAVFDDGFFVQAPSGDGDEETSDGLFVFTTVAPTVVAGDEVDVIGTVEEFFEMTELAATDVVVTGSAQQLPNAIVFDEETPSPLPTRPANEMERYEGMVVRVVDGTVSSPSNQFNEASVVAAPRRAFREPGILHPGLSGLPVWDGNPEIFEIDTDLYAASPRLGLAGGARITAEGPLAFSFGDYQIWPTALEVDAGPAVVPVGPRETGEFAVGTQNVLRLFDTADDPETDDPVLTPEAYADRLAKISLHVRQALRSPDVLAIQEVENLSTLQDLAARIQSDDAAVVYTAHLLEGNDVGGIDVGFLVRDTVRVDAVEQFGKDDLFEFGGTTAPLNDRPPLVLRGAYVANGADFPMTVINVHQRSLSGIDGSDGARIRAKRHEQALRLSQYLDALQDADANVRLVVIGDFNAFEFTDGYVDVMGQVTGNLDPAGALVPATDEVSVDLVNQTLNLPAGERYSFVFDGTAQSLDHALTSQSLNPWVRRVQHSRGNADAPNAFASDPTTALRTSDHDGTVVFLTADLDGDGVPDNLDACAATRIPEGVPAAQLRPNHFALVDGDGVFDTAAARNSPLTFTINDTRGCSCEQILERTGAGFGQTFFGCSAGTMKSWVADRR